MRDNGYSEGDIAEELQELMSGGVWASWLQLVSAVWGFGFGFSLFRVAERLQGLAAGRFKGASGFRV